MGSNLSLSSNSRQYRERSLEINLSDAISKVKALSWKPIQSLFDNPDRAPMMVFSNGRFIFYGKRESEIILGRDLGVKVRESSEKLSLVWFFLRYSFTTDRKEYHVCDHENVTHWLAWPEEPIIQEKNGSNDEHLEQV